MTLAKENGHDRAVRPQALYQGQKLAKQSIRGEEMEMTEGCGEGSICDRLNRGRVAIFIDGANLFYAALQLGIEIDYTKLLVRLTAGSKLLRSFFYTGVDRTNEKQQGFLLWMRRNGYRVVTKELVQLPDGSIRSFEQPLSIGEVAALAWLAERLAQETGLAAAPGRILPVDFDAFLSDVGGALRGIAAHLGLQPSEAQLAATPLRLQINRKIDLLPLPSR